MNINEGMNQHTLFKNTNSLETPLGRFLIKKNGRPIEFKYRVIEHDIEDITIHSFSIDIDTSDMDIGDSIILGIDGAKLSGRGSDEQCVYLDAEDDDWYLVLNGEIIDDWEVDDINDYTFVTEGYDENGFEYLIHQNPDTLKERDYRPFRVIQITMAWGLKTISDNYEEIIEQAAW